MRIETQRLRDELTDMRVELEVTQEKLRHTEDTMERDRQRKVTPITTEQATSNLRPPSPMSEASTSATTISSPSTSTPPAKSETSTLQTSPPSPRRNPPKSKAVTKKAEPPVTPARKRVALPAPTPRQSMSNIRAPRHSRGPSIPQLSATPVRPSFAPKTPRSIISRPSISQAGPPPRSESLHQIRGLIGKMQKLEQRVHTARSKLPAPTNTPPRSSPRSSLAMAGIPSTVTVRSARKRASQSTTTSAYTAPSTEPRPLSRLSFGFSTRTTDASGIQRPESRTSYVSSSGQFARPSSRASISGRQTPKDMHRPRSSISGNYAATHADTLPRSATPGPRPGHAFSRSISSASAMDGSAIPTPLTARRSTLDKNAAAALSGIPAPNLARRQSGGLGVTGRRQSGASSAAGAESGAGEMRPPSSRGRRLSWVGETF